MRFSVELNFLSRSILFANPTKKEGVRKGDRMREIAFNSASSKNLHFQLNHFRQKHPAVSVLKASSLISWLRGRGKGRTSGFHPKYVTFENKRNKSRIRSQSDVTAEVNVGQWLKSLQNVMWWWWDSNLILSSLFPTVTINVVLWLVRQIRVKFWWIRRNNACLK